MPYLENSSAPTILIGPFLDATDGVTIESGLAAGMTVYLSKEGAAQAARNASGTIVYDARGYYRVPLNAADTSTSGALKVIVQSAGALPYDKEYTVVDPSYWAFMISGSSPYVNVAAIFDSSPAAEAAADFFNNAGVDLSANTIGADMVKMNGETTPVDNAEATFDGTGYAFPNSVIDANTISIFNSAEAALNHKSSMLVVLDGVAQTGTLTSTVITSTLTGLLDDQLNGRWLIVMEGTRKYEARQILDYSATNGTITLAVALTGALANGDEFIII